MPRIAFLSVTLFILGLAAAHPAQELHTGAGAHRPALQAARG